MANQAKKKTPATKASSSGRIAFLVLGLVLSGSLIWAVRRDGSLPSAPTPAKTEAAPAAVSVPPYFENALAAKPFPKLLPASYFAGYTAAAKAYRSAGEIADVIAQQPCYCYCDEVGHRSLLDCYSSEHAARCLICIKEVLLAEKLHKQGKTAAEIREAIIRGDWRSVDAS